jgi:predicted permease
MLEARLQSGLAAFTERLPADQRRWLLRVSGVEGTPLGQQVSIVLPYLLGMSVLLTLLIACTNVAILMIAQWTAREHEIAIRASIGASRARIVRSLLTESVLVAALGGVLGVCATFALRSWIVLQAGGEPGFFDLTIDTVVLIQTAVIALATGIVAGITPALYETRRLHTNPLRTMAGSDRVRQRLRHALVVFEVAVTIALLVVTTAMIDGYRRTTKPQLGYATRPLMVAGVENPEGVPAARVLDVLNNLSGVAAAAASSTVLPFARGTQRAVAADPTGADVIMAGQTAITGRFFEALGVPMRAGRMFSDPDSAASRTAIVNESLARRLFPNGSAVGSRIWIAQRPFDVVGVVADYASNPMRRDARDAAVFLPMTAESGEATRVFFLVRAQGDPAPLVRTVPRDVREALAGTVVTNAYTVDQVLEVAGREILIGTAPLFPLIAIGMLLTTAGIYGVLAFALTRRARELAVRLAVGAGPHDLIRLVIAHTARLVVTGSLVGVAATFGLSRLVRAGGGAGSIYDPPVHAFIVPVLIVVVIGGLATWIPSRRALKIDPIVLLRTT